MEGGVFYSESSVANDQATSTVILASAAVLGLGAGLLVLFE